MELDPVLHRIRVGCAGWAVRKDRAELYGSEGSHLARYAASFAAVEINSSFYKPHRRATYERWAATVSDAFRFAVKVPRAITHERGLVGCAELLERFLDEATGLGAKLGPLLVQLPPSAAFDARIVATFLGELRARCDGFVACEPRHATWFGDAAEELLVRFRVARVAADPACMPSAALPGGWSGFAYWRWHGTPRIYYSEYGERVAALASLVRAHGAPERETWCMFDNTALGAAPVDALALMRRLSVAREDARR